jgi:mono/diheme cytochrome c family protein
VLHFTLALADAKGNSDTAKATVTVLPFRDPDHFLEYLTVDDQYAVVAATSSAVTGSSVDIPYTITITKLVSFTGRDKVKWVQVPVGTPQTFTGVWPAGAGSGGPGCAAAANPRIQAPIARLNLDDPLADGSGVLSDFLELSDLVDRPDRSTTGARVDVRVQISAPTLPVGVTPRICVVPAGGTASGTAASDALVVDADTLHGSQANHDSAAAASAYYATIDPASTKTTLNQWLDANGFSSAVSGWNADAHAVYTNNYDLGFGRDMYMKIGDANGRCDGNVNAQPVVPANIGKCDVAAVVVNYAGVEAAAKRLNAVVAVAMEYSRAGAGNAAGTRFVKFYVFVPDTRDGVFRRVNSVNLDRRGEKSVPQACVVCHGGLPGSTAADPADSNRLKYKTPLAATGAFGADLNSSFLPWDLEAFLYSDTDPGFSRRERDDAMRTAYTRANQESQFKLLNSGAYLTMADGTTAGRFALARELLEGWYGGTPATGLGTAAFNGAFVPGGWQPGGTVGNPTDSATIYRTVFAPHCRTCHVMHVPSAGDPRTATKTVTGSPPVSACSVSSPLNSTLTGTAGQAPMGCYWEFAHAANLVQHIGAGRMPFARRTLDQLWGTDGATSAGAVLKTHLEAVLTTTIPTPGTASASISVSPPSAEQGTSGDVGDLVKLDAASSLFASSISWTVEKCTGTTASAPGTCTTSVPVIGATSKSAGFVVDAVRAYRVTASINGGAVTAQQYYAVTDKPLALVANQNVQVQIGKSVEMPVPIFTDGNGARALHTMKLTPAANLDVFPAACIAGCPASTKVTLTPTVAGAANLSLGITVTDAGGEQKSTTFTVVALTKLVAPNISTSVLANSAKAPINLMTLVTAAVPAYTTTLYSVTGIQYTGPLADSPQSPTVTGNVLDYQPKAKFATHDKNGNATAPLPSQQTFRYALQRRDTAGGPVVETSDFATLVVAVKARNSLDDVRSIWGSSTLCGSCHGTSSYPSAPDFKSATNVPYASMLSRVNTTTTASSLLICWPEQTCGNTHTGGSSAKTTFDTQVLGSTNQTYLNTVTTWINDGANNF